MLLPIKSITFARPACWGDELFATITYNAGSDFAVPKNDEPMDGVRTSGWSRAADTYKVLQVGFSGPQDLEDQIAELGWYLGAGYMFRWQKRPDMPDSAISHYFGGQRYTVEIGGVAEDFGRGDYSEDMIESAAQNGLWVWEINSTYLMRCGINQFLWPKWRDEDCTRNEDGLRLSAFPGFSSSHPWMEDFTCDGYESRFYFSRPKNYNKNRDVMVNN